MCNNMLPPLAQDRTVGADCTLCFCLIKNAFCCGTFVFRSRCKPLNSHVLTPRVQVKEDVTKATTEVRPLTCRYNRPALYLHLLDLQLGSHAGGVFNGRLLAGQPLHLFLVVRCRLSQQRRLALQGSLFTLEAALQLLHLNRNHGPPGVSLIPTRRKDAPVYRSPSFSNATVSAGARGKGVLETYWGAPDEIDRACNHD